MDQLPLDYKVTMLIGDYSDLLTLLETDKEKWQCMIDDIEKQISGQIDEGLQEREQLIPSGVSLSLGFAEWINIYGIRDGEHEWKYKGDNFTKKHSSKQMFDEWQRLLTNEA